MLVFVFFWVWLMLLPICFYDDHNSFVTIAQSGCAINFLSLNLPCCIGSSILHLFSFFSINTKSLHQEIAHIWPLQVTFSFGIVYTIFIITAMRGIQAPPTQPQLVPVAYLMDKWTGISGSYLTTYCLFAVFHSMSCTAPSLSLTLLLNELSSSHSAAIKESWLDGVH